MKRAISFASWRAWQLSKILLWIPFAIWLAVVLMRTYNDVTSPVFTWFNPIRITVPDFCEGQEPFIEYARGAIRKNFEASFFSHYESARKLDFPMCGSPLNYWSYSPREATITSLKLFDFTKHKCDLPVGEWYLVMHWRVMARTHSIKNVRLASNVFKVLPKEQCANVTADQQG